VHTTARRVASTGRRYGTYRLRTADVPSAQCRHRLRWILACCFNPDPARRNSSACQFRVQFVEFGRSSRFGNC
jgi:hypothetical protein